MADKERKIKKPEKNNNHTLIYLVSLVALVVIWFTAFAQPLAFNNRLLPFGKKAKDEYYPAKKEEKQEDKKEENKKSETKKESKKQVTPSTNPRWKVGFTAMKLSKKSEFAKEISAPSFNSFQANFNVELSEPGDEMTYDLTITNNGTIDAKVSSIDLNPISEDSDAIYFSISDIKVGDELDSGKSTVMKVHVKYNPNYTGSEKTITKELTVFINYVQK